MNDGMNINGIGDQFVHDSVGIHADLPNGIFTDFRHHSAETGRPQKDINLLGDILHYAGRVAPGVMGDILVDKAQVLPCWR